LFWCAEYEASNGGCVNGIDDTADKTLRSLDDLDDYFQPRQLNTPQIDEALRKNAEVPPVIICHKQFDVSHLK